MATLLSACGGGEKTTGTPPGGGTNTTVAAVTITGAPANPQLFVGDSFQLVAAPVNATGGAVSATVSWATSAATVATVSSAGWVKAIEAGAVAISASAGGKTAPLTFDVVYGANIGPAGGSIVTPNGRFRLSVGGLFPQVRFVVTPATTPPTDARTVAGTAFEIAPAALSLLNTTAQLALQFDNTALPAGVYPQSLQLYVRSDTSWSRVIFSTVDVATRTVSGQLVRTGLYIVRSTPVDRIVLLGAAVGGSLYTGDTATIHARLHAVEGDTLPTRPISWSSSAPAVLSVDSTGKLTARTAGTATITASADGRTATFTTLVATRTVADWSRAGEWMTIGANAQHTAYVDATVDPSVFRLRWTKTPMSGASLWEATTGSGAAFVTSFVRFDGQAIVALDAVTGAVRWSRVFPSTTRLMQPVWENGTVYLQALDGTNSAMYALRGTDGAEQYRGAFTPSSSRWFSPPIIVGASLVAGALQEMLGFSKATGAQQFSRPAIGLALASAAGDNATAYFIDANGITGISPTTGAVTKQITDSRITSDALTLTLAAPNVLVAVTPVGMAAVDVSTSSVRWFATSGVGFSLAAANGTMYTLENGALTARAVASGVVQWQSPPSCDGAMVLTNNVIFLACTDGTYAIDLASHLAVWSTPVTGNLSVSGPDGALYITNGATVTAFSLR